MSFLELKSSLGYIWFSLICFLIQIYCHIDNLGIIRYYQSIINENLEDISLIICLIIIIFTIICSSISIVLNILNDFGNSIEDYPFYLNKYKKTSLPLLCLFDIIIAIFILLPKLIINSQFIKLKIKDQSFIFESSIDFLIGNGISRIKKDGLSILTIDSKSKLSSEILNLFLILIRYNFNYSNIFYKLNLKLSIIININSILIIILCLITYSIFEIFFKEIFLINISLNIYSYLLIISLIISILLILLTNHCLYNYGKLIYFQQQYQISNELIRLSKFNDRYLMCRSIRHCLIIYLLFVILSILSQFPLIILTLKYFLSGLIDNLLIIYLILILLFIFLSIILFIYLYFYSLTSFHFNQNNQIKSFETFYRSNLNVEDKLFVIESPNLIPTRSISSSGLTVIDYGNFNGRNSHPTFQQTPGIATDNLLVMH